MRQVVRLMTFAGTTSITKKQTENLKMKIYKHTHHALALPSLICPYDGVRFNISFNNTARYETKEVENQSDWNKLFGFTIGMFPSFKGGFKPPVHWNSVRFGWRYNPLHDTIEVCPYIYKDGVVFYYGKEMYLPIVELDFGKVYKFSLVMNLRGIVHFDIDLGRENLLNYWMQYEKSDLGWMSWPYFGGDETAPHTIDIDFEYV